MVEGALLFSLWRDHPHRPTRDLDLLGFGDVVTPAATYVDFPSLIGLRPPHVRVYPPETVVAEKYEALVRLGAINSRVKDFYDLWALARKHVFAGTLLTQALRATFKRRGTPLTATTPFAITGAFATDPAKLQLWQAFVSCTTLEPVALTLAATMERLRAFLTPPTEALLSGQNFGKQRDLGGPWRLTTA